MHIKTHKDNFLHSFPVGKKVSVSVYNIITTECRNDSCKLI